MRSIKSAAKRVLSQSLLEQLRLWKVKQQYKELVGKSAEEVWLSGSYGDKESLLNLVKGLLDKSLGLWLLSDIL